MSATVDITESLTFAAVRAYLQSILPTGVEIVKAQQNGVPEPTSADHVVLTPITRERLSTNIEVYQDNTGGSYRYAVTPTNFSIQADIYGPNSSDYSQIVRTLWRDRNATDYFGSLTIGALTGNATITTLFNGAPLHASDPKQLVFINGADVYEPRWSVDLALQVNPTITTAQQFAASLVVDLISVDAKYPA